MILLHISRQWQDVALELGWALKQLLRQRRRLRSAKVIALSRLTAKGMQQLNLLFTFKPFGDHLEREGLCQRQNAADQGAASALLGQAHDERAVKLQRLKRQTI